MAPDRKQPGVHYTQVDISEYMAKNTIIPFLFDATKKKCPAAFDTDWPMWRFLRENPDRYIYPAIRDENYLPTETGREYAARRKRYAELKDRMVAGKVTSVNDLITYNLDISRFALDVIAKCEEPDLLLALYQNIGQITVLDPACGSGAFLLAALNVLEPLYEACLERMEFWHKQGFSRVGFLVRSHGESYAGDHKGPHPIPHHPRPYGTKGTSTKNLPVRGPQGSPTRLHYPVLDLASASSLHLSGHRRFFILKSIICNNLYGVDIEKEAVEICKLRLLLKLISRIECVEDIEALPDIDQHIRVGNTLIGFTTLEQVNHSGDISDILSRGQVCQEGLDRACAKQYGIDPQDRSRFEQWHSRYQPLHWCAEFDKVMSKGGFDVIIGNPPYVEYSDAKADYHLLLDTYKASSCGNLYAFCLERSIELLHDDGRWGMIVPLSGFSTERMRNLQQLVIERSSCLHLSFLSGDANPSKLFEGVKFRLCIALAKVGKDERSYYSTRYVRWYAKERERLFHSLEYCESTEAMISGSLPKIGQEIELDILKKMGGQPPLRNFRDHGDYQLYYHTCPVNWIRATTFVPRFSSDRDGTKVSSQIRQVKLQSEELRDAAVCIINSSLFFWFWLLYSDCYHLNKREMGNFPINLNELVQQNGELLSSLSSDLMLDYKKHSQERTYVYKSTGRVVYDEFYPKLSKPIIDEIDRVLARYYGFDTEELDFILNYEEKYRMGNTSYRK